VRPVRLLNPERLIHQVRPLGPDRPECRDRRNRQQKL